MRMSDWSSDVCSSDLQERGQPKRGEQREPAFALRHRVGDDAEQQEQEEADMDGAHHLARQRRVHGGPELEGGESDGDRDEDDRAGPFAPTELELARFVAFSRDAGGAHGAAPPDVTSGPFPYSTSPTPDATGPAGSPPPCPPPQ